MSKTVDPNAMTDDRLPRLSWLCRRGMLELDVILQPFLQQHYLTLTETQKLAFIALLDCPDPDLYTWLMGYGQADEEYQAIIAVIRDKTGITE